MKNTPVVEISHFKFPPKDYAKFLAVDPGNARAGFVCGAVPPPPEGVDIDRYEPDRIDIWAEAMLYNPTASKLAYAIQELTGNFLFETFIMDEHFGRQRRNVETTDTAREQYAQVLAKLGVRCRKWGSDFEWGTDDVDGRELLVKSWMTPRDDKPPILRIHRDCTNLHRQIDGFYRSKTDHTRREGSQKKPLELVASLEYMIGHFNGQLYYVPPEPAAPAEDKPKGCEKLLKEWQKANWDPFNTQRMFGPTFGAR